MIGVGCGISLGSPTRTAQRRPPKPTAADAEVAAGAEEPIVPVDATEPEVGSAEPVFGRIAEHLLRASTHERKARRTGIGFPEDRAELLDQVAAGHGIVAVGVDEAGRDGSAANPA